MSNIFIDFDGVIADTNNIKKTNISSAYYNITGNYNKEFVKYFTENNGIPRELKLKKFINNDILEHKILHEYSALNDSLLNANINQGLISYLKKNRNKDVFILSGGDYKEIELFLIKKNINKYFNKILCGPKTKDENLKSIEITENDLFIGDSKHDYSVAKNNCLKFIFMTNYTQEKSPFEFLDKSVLIVKNFEELI